MKYIIMAGGHYQKWSTPKQLLEIKGEPIIGRTIRILKELGIKDISISTDNDVFSRFGVPLLKHDNEYDAIEYNNATGHWCNGIYPTTEPATYLFGDVVYSNMALRTITEYETDDIMLFGSKEPFAPEYPKWYIEPFGFKVVNQEHMMWAVKEVKRLHSIGAFNRLPIAWELWNVICGTDPNTINNTYVAINDYTCDIDYPEEIANVEPRVKEAKPMATKKTEHKKPAQKRTRKKAETVTYKGREFEVLDRQNNKVMLTDGTIHFWTKAKNVEA